MKLTRVEQAFDGSRLLFYFTAEARVDFRELVRELAAEFRTRIEMRQIGVRDEAKALGGYGTCGRPLCCTTFLTVVRAGVDQDGQAAGPEPQPVEALGAVRPAEVLPSLRTAQREGAGSRRVRQRGRLRQPVRLRDGQLRQRRMLERFVRVPVNRPRIALTVGDPAGIGPEIAAKAALDPTGPRGVRADHLRAARHAAVRAGRALGRRRAGRVRRDRPRGRGTRRPASSTPSPPRR